MLIDTHAHLYAKQFDGDRAKMIERAKQAGVEAVYLPNIDIASIEPMLELEKAYPDFCFPMMGLHPCSVKEDYQEVLAVMKEWLYKRPFLAVGEIGMDLYWDKSFRQEQEIAFVQQVEWAIDLDLPIVIHARETTDILIDLVRANRHPRLRGVFHCFGGSVEQAEAIMELGFYLGIGGVLTFKKSGLDRTLSAISLDRVILETDSPYLAPTPYRGKRNESAYVAEVANKLAQVKGRTIEEIGQITTKNAQSLFVGQAKEVN